MNDSLSTPKPAFSTRKKKPWGRAPYIFALHTSLFMLFSERFQSVSGKIELSNGCKNGCKASRATKKDLAGSGQVLEFFGAGNGIRTRDLQLGKLTLYH
jgi:hypothetical protein